MIAPGTGYVRLQDFSETTDTELSAALKKLKTGGMQRLILDLRDNPGGPLNQAIAVANHFLHKGQMIVYTRGRVENSDDDYRAVGEGNFTDVPLIVLVSRQSASASEIVTGLDAGPRPWSGHRRDDVRQGARAIGLLDRQRGPGPHHGALLHAERAADSASVGRQLRRVPHVLRCGIRPPIARTRRPS